VQPKVVVRIRGLVHAEPAAVSAVLAHLMGAPVVPDHGTPSVQPQLASDALKHADRRLQRASRYTAENTPVDVRGLEPLACRGTLAWTFSARKWSQRPRAICGQIRASRCSPGVDALLVTFPQRDEH
jgi:hypothetical protein